MDLDTLRLRLIEKFIGYQLRWIEDEQESPSALLRFWSFSKWILLRRLPYYCCGSSRQKKRSLRGRIYLTGRICEIVASLDNHRSPKLILRVITRRRLQKKLGRTDDALAAGTFSKDDCAPAFIPCCAIFCNEVRNSHFTKLPAVLAVWHGCRQTFRKNVGMQRGLKLLPGTLLYKSSLGT